MRERLKVSREEEVNSLYISISCTYVNLKFKAKLHKFNGREGSLVGGWMGGGPAFIFLWRRVGRVCNCFDIHQ